MNFLLTGTQRRFQPRLCRFFRFTAGTNKNILLCIGRFSKFPSAEITTSTSSKTVIEFLQDKYNSPRHTYLIRVDQASCFTSQGFKLVCDSNKIKITFRTVENHRSNGLVEKLVHIVKIKFWLCPRSSKMYIIKRYLKNHLEPSVFLPIKIKLLSFRNTF